ncbi:Hypothetical protein R9X50_00245900 [Acrodontium crateriforme]|uniref:Vacuolar protein sorting-associated protein 9a n=1 Tax=Acrodontium crateriforme TaxID=150365 RepID=A0AAQ3R8K0_9PEZI|nr:Hypothetical protein R9X50_00245900 [Acrodontium crateriforme]
MSDQSDLRRSAFKDEPISVVSPAALSTEQAHHGSTNNSGSLLLMSGLEKSGTDCDMVGLGDETLHGNHEAVEDKQAATTRPTELNAASAHTTDQLVEQFTGADNAKNDIATGNVSPVTSQELINISNAALPPSPPPPAPPRKDEDIIAPKRSGDIQKRTSQEETSGGVPEALPGSAEAAGAEIQNIMGQFDNGSGGVGEQEIMSPRLERQQSLLILPPRTSSLEHRDSFALSPQTTGQSVKSISSPLSSDINGRAPSISGSIVENIRSDDTESIISVRPGSIINQPPPSPDPEPALPFDFHRFLEQLRHRTADPVARFLRSFLNEFGKKPWMVHEQVKIISDFLEFITKKMAQCEVWRTVSDAEFDNAREGMEKLVMNRLYSQTFSPAIPAASGSPRKGAKGGRSHADIANPHGPGRRGQHQEDVERDEVIAQKIRIYGWIREEHLDIKPISEKGRKFLTLAQQELLKINTYRAPRDKVICVLNCCKVIFGFLKNAKGDQSADTFVPLLIYTVLHARPEHLVSNVQYIWRFRNQDKLGGEAGYYMSSLMGVVTFIENLDRTNITISDEQFERNVEQAVSAIAEKNKSEEYEGNAHASVVTKPLQQLNEKSALSRPEVTPRNSMDAEQSSPRRAASQRYVEKGSGDNEDVDTVTGLLRTIQRPLSSIGRIFADDSTSQLQQTGSRPASTPVPGPTPTALSPSMRADGGRANNEGFQPSSNQERSGHEQRNNVKAAVARQTSAEAVQAQRVSTREPCVVVETLQNMFPALDREVLEDVVRSHEGNISRAVDACLALSG